MSSQRGDGTRVLADACDFQQEVAQSLPLDVLSPGAAEALAGDVEYRIHLIIQEAKKFMIHGKRGTLLPEDIEHAMEALNVEVSRVTLNPSLFRKHSLISQPSSLFLYRHDHFRSQPLSLSTCPLRHHPASPSIMFQMTKSILQPFSKSHYRLASLILPG